MNAITMGRNLPSERTARYKRGGYKRNCRRDHVTYGALFMLRDSAVHIPIIEGLIEQLQYQLTQTSALTGSTG